MPCPRHSFGAPTVAGLGFAAAMLAAALLAAAVPAPAVAGHAVVPVDGGDGRGDYRRDDHDRRGRDGGDRRGGRHGGRYDDRHGAWHGRPAPWGPSWGPSWGYGYVVPVYPPYVRVYPRQCFLVWNWWQQRYVQECR